MTVFWIAFAVCQALSDSEIQFLHSLIQSNEDGLSAVSKSALYSDIPPYSIASNMGFGESALLRLLSISCFKGREARRHGFDRFQFLENLFKEFKTDSCTDEGCEPSQIFTYLSQAVEKEFMRAYNLSPDLKIISYSSHESLHLGGNWAYKFILELKFPGSNFQVFPDIHCADIWFFRGSPPPNFSGVAILVDAEKNAENSGYPYFKFYPFGIYLGPDIDSFNETATLPIYLPFVSSHFAQRSKFSAQDLLRSSSHPEKPFFLAYLARNCVKHREFFFEKICNFAKENNWDGCDALGSCGRIEKFPGRYDTEYLDEAVDILKPYKFVMAFENENSPGYVTEKIAAAFLANAIPIYFGTDNVHAIFNNKSFIHVRDITDESWKDQISRLMHDDVAFSRMKSESIILDDFVFSWQSEIWSNYTNRSLRDNILEAINFQVVRRDQQYDSSLFEFSVSSLSRVSLYQWN